MFRRILVPLDGSSFGEHALPMALSIAERAHANLHLVYVHKPLTASNEGSEPIADPVTDKSERDSKRNYLLQVSERLRKTSSVGLSMVVPEGARAESLCEEAAAWKADLIVMTTHGRGPLTRVWLGSVADQVIRQSSIPVLLIRPQNDRLDLADRPVLENILVPLDGSELAERILPCAQAMAQLMKAKFTLLQVIEPMIVPSYEWGGNALNGLSPEQIEAVQVHARDYLEKAAGKLDVPTANVHKVVAFNVPAINAILAEAGNSNTSLIALETHGRGGWKRFLLGSVADKLIRGANVPVLVNRPPAQ